MKLMNTDMDTLFFSGVPSSEHDGLVVTLGQPVTHLGVVNQFILADNNGCQSLVDLNLSKAEFRYEENRLPPNYYVPVPLLRYRKNGRRDNTACLLTGTPYTNMAGQPNVSGILLERPEDRYSVKVLAGGVNQVSSQQTYMNLLLEVPVTALYVLNGVGYSLKDDRIEVPHMSEYSGRGVYFDINNLLAQQVK